MLAMIFLMPAALQGLGKAFGTGSKIASFIAKAAALAKTMATFTLAVGQTMQTLATICVLKGACSQDTAFILSTALTMAITMAAGAFQSAAQVAAAQALADDITAEFISEGVDSTVASGVAVSIASAVSGIPASVITSSLTAIVIEQFAIGLIFGVIKGEAELQITKAIDNAFCPASADPNSTCSDEDQILEQTLGVIASTLGAVLATAAIADVSSVIFQNDSFGGLIEQDFHLQNPNSISSFMENMFQAIQQDFPQILGQAASMAARLIALKAADVKATDNLSNALGLGFMTIADSACSELTSWCQDQQSPSLQVALGQAIVMFGFGMLENSVIGKYNQAEARYNPGYSYGYSLEQEEYLTIAMIGTSIVESAVINIGGGSWKGFLEGIIGGLGLPQSPPTTVTTYTNNGSPENIPMPGTTSAPAPFVSSIGFFFNNIYPTFQNSPLGFVQFSDSLDQMSGFTAEGAASADIMWQQMQMQNKTVYEPAERTVGGLITAGPVTPAVSQSELQEQFLLSLLESRTMIGDPGINVNYIDSQLQNAVDTGLFELESSALNGLGDIIRSVQHPDVTKDGKIVVKINGEEEELTLDQYLLWKYGKDFREKYNTTDDGGYTDKSGKKVTLTDVVSNLLPNNSKFKLSDDGKGFYILLKGKPMEDNNHNKKELTPEQLLIVLLKNKGIHIDYILGIGKDGKPVLNGVRIRTQSFLDHLQKWGFPNYKAKTVNGVSYFGTMDNNYNFHGYSLGGTELNTNFVMPQCSTNCKPSPGNIQGIPPSLNLNFLVSPAVLKSLSVGNQTTGDLLGLNLNIMPKTQSSATVTFNIVPQNNASPFSTVTFPVTGLTPAATQNVGLNIFGVQTTGTIPGFNFKFIQNTTSTVPPTLTFSTVTTPAMFTAGTQVPINGTANNSIYPAQFGAGTVTNTFAPTTQVASPLIPTAEQFFAPPSPQWELHITQTYASGGYSGYLAPKDDAVVPQDINSIFGHVILPVSNWSGKRSDIEIGNPILGFEIVPIVLNGSSPTGGVKTTSKVKIAAMMSISQDDNAGGFVNPTPLPLNFLYAAQGSVVTSILNKGMRLQNATNAALAASGIKYNEVLASGGNIEKAKTEATDAYDTVFKQFMQSKQVVNITGAEARFSPDGQWTLALVGQGNALAPAVSQAGSGGKGYTSQSIYTINTGGMDYLLSTNHNIIVNSQNLNHQQLEFALPNITAAVNAPGGVYRGPVEDNNFSNGAQAYFGQTIAASPNASLINGIHLLGPQNTFYGAGVLFNASGSVSPLNTDARGSTYWNSYELYEYFLNGGKASVTAAGATDEMLSQGQIPGWTLVGTKDTGGWMFDTNYTPNKQKVSINGVEQTPEGQFIGNPAIEGTTDHLTSYSVDILNSEHGNISFGLPNANVAQNSAGEATGKFGIIPPQGTIFNIGYGSFINGVSAVPNSGTGFNFNSLGVYSSSSNPFPTATQFFNNLPTSSVQGQGVSGNPLPAPTLEKPDSSLPGTPPDNTVANSPGSKLPERTVQQVAPGYYNIGLITPNQKIATITVDPHEGPILSFAPIYKKAGFTVIGNLPEFISGAQGYYGKNGNLNITGEIITAKRENNQPMLDGNKFTVDDAGVVYASQGSDVVTQFDNMNILGTYWRQAGDVMAEYTSLLNNVNFNVTDTGTPTGDNGKLNYSRRSIESINFGNGNVGIHPDQIGVNNSSGNLNITIAGTGNPLIANTLEAPKPQAQPNRKVDEKPSVPPFSIMGTVGLNNDGTVVVNGQQRADVVISDFTSPHAYLSGDFRNEGFINTTGDWVTYGVQRGEDGQANGVYQAKGSVYQVNGSETSLISFTDKGLLNNNWRAMALENKDMLSLLGIKSDYNDLTTNILFKLKYLEYGADGHIVDNGIVLSDDRTIRDALGGIGFIRRPEINKDVNGNSLMLNVDSVNLITGRGVVFEGKVYTVGDPLMEDIRDETGKVIISKEDRDGRQHILSGPDVSMIGNLQESSKSSVDQSTNLPYYLAIGYQNGRFVNKGQAQYMVDFDSTGNGFATQFYGNTLVNNLTGADELVLFDMKRKGSDQSKSVAVESVLGNSLFYIGKNQNLSFLKEVKGTENAQIEVKKTGELGQIQSTEWMALADEVLPVGKEIKVPQNVTVTLRAGQKNVEVTKEMAAADPSLKNSVGERVTLDHDVTINFNAGATISKVTPELHNAFLLAPEGKQMVQMEVGEDSFTLDAFGGIKHVDLGTNTVVNYSTGQHAAIDNPENPVYDKGAWMLTVNGTSIPVGRGILPESELVRIQVENEYKPGITPIPAGGIKIGGTVIVPGGNGKTITPDDQLLIEAAILNLSKVPGTDAIKSGNNNKNQESQSNVGEFEVTDILGNGVLSGSGIAQYRINLNNNASGSATQLYNNITLLNETNNDLRLFDVQKNDAKHTVVGTETLEGNQLNGKYVFYFDGNQRIYTPRGLTKSEQNQLGDWAMAGVGGDNFNMVQTMKTADLVPPIGSKLQRSETIGRTTYAAGTLVDEALYEKIWHAIDPLGRGLAQMQEQATLLRGDAKGGIKNVIFGSKVVDYSNKGTAEIVNINNPVIKNGQLMLTVNNAKYIPVAAGIKTNEEFTPSNEQTTPLQAPKGDEAIQAKLSQGQKGEAAKSQAPKNMLVFTLLMQNGQLTGSGTAKYFITSDSTASGSATGMYDNIHIVNKTPYDINLWDVIKNNDIEHPVAVDGLQGSTLNNRNQFYLNAYQTIIQPDNVNPKSLGYMVRASKGRNIFNAVEALREVYLVFPVGKFIVLKEPVDITLPAGQKNVKLTKEMIDQNPNSLGGYKVGDTVMLTADVHIHYEAHNRNKDGSLGYEITSEIQQAFLSSGQGRKMIQMAEALTYLVTDANGNTKAIAFGSDKVRFSDRSDIGNIENVEIGKTIFDSDKGANPNGPLIDQEGSVRIKVNGERLAVAAGAMGEAKVVPATPSDKESSPTAQGVPQLGAGSVPAPKSKAWMWALGLAGPIAWPTLAAGVILNDLLEPSQNSQNETSKTPKAETPDHTFVVSTDTSFWSDHGHLWYSSSNQLNGSGTENFVIRLDGNASGIASADWSGIHIINNTGNGLDIDDIMGQRPDSYGKEQNTVVGTMAVFGEDLNFDEHGNFKEGEHPDNGFLKMSLGVNGYYAQGHVYLEDRKGINEVSNKVTMVQNMQGEEYRNGKLTFINPENLLLGKDSDGKLFMAYMRDDKISEPLGDGRLLRVYGTIPTPGVQLSGDVNLGREGGEKENNNNTGKVMPNYVVRVLNDQGQDTGYSRTIKGDFQFGLSGLSSMEDQATPSYANTDFETFGIPLRGIETMGHKAIDISVFGGADSDNANSKYYWSSTLITFDKNQQVASNGLIVTPYNEDKSIDNEAKVEGLLNTLNANKNITHYKVTSYGFGDSLEATTIFSDVKPHTDIYYWNWNGKTGTLEVPHDITGNVHIKANDGTDVMAIKYELGSWWGGPYDSHVETGKRFYLNDQEESTYHFESDNNEPEHLINYGAVERNGVFYNFEGSKAGYVLLSRIGVQKPSFWEALGDLGMEGSINDENKDSKAASRINQVFKIGEGSSLLDFHPENDLRMFNKDRTEFIQITEHHIVTDRMTAWGTIKDTLFGRDWIGRTAFGEWVAQETDSRIMGNLFDFGHTSILTPVTVVLDAIGVGEAVQFGRAALEGGEMFDAGVKALRAAKITEETVKAGEITADALKTAGYTGDALVAGTRSLRELRAVGITAEVLENAPEVTKEAFRAVGITSDAFRIGTAESLRIAGITRDALDAGVITTKMLRDAGITGKALRSGTITAEGLNAVGITAEVLENSGITGRAFKAVGITSDALKASETATRAVVNVDRTASAFQIFRNSWGASAFRGAQNYYKSMGVLGKYSFDFVAAQHIGFAVGLGVYTLKTPVREWNAGEALANGFGMAQTIGRVQLLLGAGKLIGLGLGLGAGADSSLSLSDKFVQNVFKITEGSRAGKYLYPILVNGSRWVGSEFLTYGVPNIISYSSGHGWIGGHPFSNANLTLLAMGFSYPLAKAFSSIGLEGEGRLWSAGRIGQSSLTMGATWGQINATVAASKAGYNNIPITARELWGGKFDSKGELILGGYKQGLVSGTLFGGIAATAGEIVKSESLLGPWFQNNPASATIIKYGTAGVLGAGANIAAGYWNSTSDHPYLWTWRQVVPDALVGAGIAMFGAASFENSAFQKLPAWKKYALGATAVAAGRVGYGLISKGSNYTLREFTGDVMVGAALGLLGVKYMTGLKDEGVIESAGERFADKMLAKNLLKTSVEGALKWTYVSPAFTVGKALWDNQLGSINIGKHNNYDLLESTINGPTSGRWMNVVFNALQVQGGTPTEGSAGKYLQAIQRGPMEGALGQHIWSNIVYMPGLMTLTDSVTKKIGDAFAVGGVGEMTSQFFSFGVMTTLPAYGTRGAKEAQEGRELLNNREIDKAAAKFAEASILDPDNRGYLETQVGLLGQAAFKGAGSAEGEKVLNKISVLAQRVRSLYMESGDSEGLENFNNNVDNTHEVYYYYSGVNKFNNRDYDGAVADWDTAKAYDPQNGNYDLLQAKAYLHMYNGKNYAFSLLENFDEAIGAAKEKFKGNENRLREVAGVEASWHALDANGYYKAGYRAKAENSDLESKNNYVIAEESYVEAEKLDPAEWRYTYNRALNKFAMQGKVTPEVRKLLDDALTKATLARSRDGQILIQGKIDQLFPSPENEASLAAKESSKPEPGTQGRIVTSDNTAAAMTTAEQQMEINRTIEWTKGRTPNGVRKIGLKRGESRILC